MDITWNRAKGGYIFGKSGKRYVDFTSGVMVTNIGHANPRVLKALKCVIDIPLLYTYRYPHLNKKKLINSLLRFTDNQFSDVIFGTTGSEAVEIGLKICARYFENTNRHNFIAFNNAFHGKTLGASLLSDIKRYKPKKLTSDINLVKRIIYPKDSHDNSFIIKELQKLKESSMAIFIECIQGSTLLKMNIDLLRYIRKYCDENEILMVIDEIQTGFYRTGPKFCYLQSKITPDIICLGKGLTSSLPLSAVLIKKKLIPYCNEDLDSQTFSGNSLSIAASLACISEYKSKSFLIRFKLAESLFKKMMQTIKSKILPKIEVIYHGGLYGGLKFNINNYEQHIIDNFVQACRERGLFVSSGIGPDINIIKFTPPLILTPSQIDFAKKIIINNLESLHLTQK